MLMVRTEWTNEWMSYQTKEQIEEELSQKHFKDCHIGNQWKDYNVGKFNLLLQTAQQNQQVEDTVSLLLLQSRKDF